MIRIIILVMAIKSKFQNKFNLNILYIVNGFQFKKRLKSDLLGMCALINSIGSGLLILDVSEGKKN